VARVPSLAEAAAASYRISVVRTADSPEGWVAQLDDAAGTSARGGTPAEAVERVWTAYEQAAVPAAQADEASIEQAPKVVAQHSGKLLVRMPATLHDELARAAEAEGVSLNQLITGVLAASVEWRTGNDRPAAAGAPGSRELTSSERWLSARVTRAALAANFTVVLVAAVAAIALLVVAWRDAL